MYDNKIKSYIDLKALGIISIDPSLYKTAEDATNQGRGLIDTIRSYVGAHIDENDKLGSFIKIMGPGLIYGLFSALGMGWIGMILAAVASVFDFDLNALIKSIVGEVKGSTNDGQKQLAPKQVEQIVENAVDKHLEKKDDADKNQAIASNNTLRDARIVKLAMITKSANPLAGAAARVAAGPAKNMLVKFLIMLLKSVLAACGLMVAGDLYKKYVSHEPNAIDRTTQSGKPLPPHVSKQTRFQIQPSYPVNENLNRGKSFGWLVNITNNEQAISDMLIKFAKDVYQGLDGLENIIVNSQDFKETLHIITSFNRSSTGFPGVSIPTGWTSRKQIVDTFIEDVAEIAPLTPHTSAP